MELFLAIPAAGHVLIMLPNALNDKALAGISMKFDLAGMFVGKEFTEVTANLPCKTWSSNSIGEKESAFADVERILQQPYSLQVELQEHLRVQFIATALL